MPLNIEATWSRPLDLKLARSGAIYEGAELDEIPEEAGVYVFLRSTAAPRRRSTSEERRISAAALSSSSTR